MEDHAKTHTLLERAEAFARSRLSERRYEHTLRVADTAQRLALAHDLDAEAGHAWPPCCTTQPARRGPKNI